MSNKLANFPAIALSAYILVLPTANANESMHGIIPKNYFKPSCDQYPNNASVEGVSLVLVEKEIIAKANIENESDVQLIAEFNVRAEKWEKETAIHSSPGATLLHKDYIAIISKGVANKKVIVPLILNRLQTSGADWFFALENITGENPAKNAENFDAAFNAWSGWAKAQGLIKETNEVLAA
jgi:hypothetical protein